MMASNPSLVSSMISHHVASYDKSGRLKDTPANRALHPVTPSDESFQQLFNLNCCYWHDDTTVILQGDAQHVLRKMHAVDAMVNCAVTSPPYYGQRDYGVEDEIGLERDPQDFINALRDIFHELNGVLTETGSLWVNIGDTYWSGKGASTGVDSKQSARRFGKRPQDYPGDGHWMRPKQLLLIPHRMAIALQDDDWLVRNDNIWVKPNPVPDPVRDRCSVSHEHVFHFTKSRWYYFDKSKVGTRNDNGRIIPPKDTWIVQQSSGASSGSAEHKASYPLELLRIPVDSTTPDNGVVLDPFMGSGTTLQYARMKGYRSIGIEPNPEYCELAVRKIKEAE
jgi:site-specific DNA-methyltransferase (adenine-specific)